MNMSLWKGCALLCLLAACDESTGSAVEAARARPILGDMPPIRIGDTPIVRTTPCEATQCFDVSTLQGVSFIAVDAEPCDGADVSIVIYDEDGEPIDIDPILHGQGRSCPAGMIEPDALKWEMTTDSRHYTVCVTYDGSTTVGSVDIVTKAGRRCDAINYAGACDACTDGGGGSNEGGSAQGGSGEGGSHSEGGAGEGGAPHEGGCGEGGADEGGASEGGASDGVGGFCPSGIDVTTF